VCERSLLLSSSGQSLAGGGKGGGRHHHSSVAKRSTTAMIRDRRGNERMPFLVIGTVGEEEDFGKRGFGRRRKSREGLCRK
jgi:hypothetical protein